MTTSTLLAPSENRSTTLIDHTAVSNVRSRWTQFDQLLRESAATNPAHAHEFNALQALINRRYPAAEQAHEVRTNGGI